MPNSRQKIRKIASAFGNQLYPMSNIIWEMVEPYLEPDDDQEIAEHFTVLAIVAWNLALLEPDDHKRQFAKILETVKEDHRGHTAEVVTDFIFEKKQNHPQDRRRILEYKLTPRMGGYDLYIDSTV